MSPSKISWRDLRGALDRGELSVYYQPIISISDGSVVAFEALVRWSHPERGMVPPSIFVPIAEETGLVLPIGDWILETACRQMKERSILSVSIGNR